VTVSMRVLSVGEGFRYLLKSVTVGDAERRLGDPLTRYYAEKGTPPGYWLGRGVASFGSGQLADGELVTEDHLRLLLGLGCDPITGNPLGRAYPRYESPAPSSDDRRPSRRRAVAGFDFTFSVPKSVSILWAIADARTQSAIVRAHHDAIADVVNLLEREIAVTRVGSDAGDGSVAQMDVDGVAATAYDHYDSRSGDPQLHTHVVIANKVRAVHDGRWRTLDGRPLHAAVVALSEHYNSVLADRITNALGLGWERRERGDGRSEAFELALVNEGLVQAFSSRSQDIDIETDRLIDSYRMRHGRDPSLRMIIKLRQQATISTRPEKELRSLAELTAEWRAAADDILGAESTSWASRTLAGSTAVASTHAEDLALSTIETIANGVVEEVQQKRSVWRYWNLHAEASRQLAERRFATTGDREKVLGLVVDAALHTSIRLTPPEFAPSPSELRRGDGTSRLRPHRAEWYSSARILEAEDRLLDLASAIDAPVVQPPLVDEAFTRGPRDGITIGADQADAIRAIAASARRVDLLVGPAGTGKTTTLRALRSAWEDAHGDGSVVGLAPSAAAADVLAGELEINTENTAKWLWEHAHSGWSLRTGQLVIVDEASLAGTLTLEAIASHAAEVGAKILLVGDPAQLGAVEAGSAFRMLVRHREDHAKLTGVRRFSAEWEAQASLRLREGDATVLEEYERHGRIEQGSGEEVLDAAHRAWRADWLSGRRTVLIADTNEAVTELNVRARRDRLLLGEVDATEAVRLRDGVQAGRGDLVVTRQNDRRLRAGSDWVRNGDRWTIDRVHPDGSLTLSRLGSSRGLLRLPATYVAAHLDLGYAVTVHRAQGSTVDSAHAVVLSGTTTREAFYVAMTRGRRSNIAYVAVDRDALEAHQRDDDDGRAVLAEVLSRTSVEPSARETVATEQDRWGGIAQIAGEYDTIATSAQRPRWLALLARVGVELAQGSAEDEFPTLAAALRRAEARGLDIESAVRDLARERGDLEVADLTARLNRDAARRATPNRTQPGFVAGLIPRARGLMSQDDAEALEARAALIESRATALVTEATGQGAPWILSMGQPPSEIEAKKRWTASAVTIAAYRDRYGIVSALPLGGRPESKAQEFDRDRARLALHEARALGTTNRGRQGVGSSSRGPRTPSL
jgi:conjugative relaxase-like TrwC/TraI family protein